MITQKRLKEVLEYAPETGEFRYRKCTNSRAKYGEKAGTTNDKGYQLIGIDNARFYAHRLAWFYIYGVWPNEVDHINRVPSDNRLSNLRSGSRSDNQHNVGVRKDNTSGEKGVYWDKRRQKWSTMITINKQRLFLGYFASVEEGKQAYKNAKVKRSIT